MTEQKQVISNVQVFPNGMVAVFDQHGQQMAQYQGKWVDMKSDIYANYNGYIEGEPEADRKERQRSKMDKVNKQEETFTLPRNHPLAGTEARVQTWGELGEELKSKLEKQLSSGDPKEASQAHDLLVLLHIIAGKQDEPAENHVVLTASGEKKNRIADLRKQLAAEEAAA